MGSQLDGQGYPGNAMTSRNPSFRDGLGKETMSELQNNYSPDALLASFFFTGGPGQLILITSDRGAGKSRWCKRLADHAISIGLDIGGVLSPAVIDNGDKTGIDVFDLRTGIQRNMAIPNPKATQPETGRAWLFDEETLQWANKALAKAENCQLLIIDELGPLEFKHDAGFTNGFALIDEKKYMLACVVVRNMLLEEAKSRWPWGHVLNLSTDNPQNRIHRATP